MCGGERGVEVDRGQKADGCSVCRVGNSSEVGLCVVG